MDATKPKLYGFSMPLFHSVDVMRLTTMHHLFKDYFWQKGKPRGREKLEEDKTVTELLLEIKKLMMTKEDLTLLRTEVKQEVSKKVRPQRSPL